MAEQMDIGAQQDAMAQAAAQRANEQAQAHSYQQAMAARASSVMPEQSSQEMER